MRSADCDLGAVRSGTVQDHPAAHATGCLSVVLGSGSVNSVR
uniref:Uncharacterized protein n=1 Tax=Nonomuraea gerenzanensis TaxID=93944 RepID=A0A1M4ECZ0_9ACTN|nr:hypothetical protein BN4615_P6170 [Nonomuraea gerenzanensis]